MGGLVAPSGLSNEIGTLSPMKDPRELTGGGFRRRIRNPFRATIRSARN